MGLTEIAGMPKYPLDIVNAASVVFTPISVRMDDGTGGRAALD